MWREAALIVERLRAHGGYADKLGAANFRHDVLIAANCRRVGATLITANRRDFALIASVRGLHFTTGFPERARGERDRGDRRQWRAARSAARDRGW